MKMNIPLGNFPLTCLIRNSKLWTTTTKKMETWTLESNSKKFGCSYEVVFQMIQQSNVLQNWNGNIFRSAIKSRDTPWANKNAKAVLPLWNKRDITDHCNFLLFFLMITFFNSIFEFLFGIQIPLQIDIGHLDYATLNVHTRSNWRSNLQPLSLSYPPSL